MLKILFYNSSQKYFAESEQFSNFEANQKAKLAQLFADFDSEISGWTVFEKVGGEWFPYRPFNPQIRYDKCWGNVS